MKKYKKVEIVAKNQVAGSYAAGCPSKGRGEECYFLFNDYGKGCKGCYRAQ